MGSFHSFCSDLISWLREVRRAGDGAVGLLAGRGPGINLDRGRVP